MLGRRLVQSPSNCCHLGTNAFCGINPKVDQTSPPSEVPVYVLTVCGLLAGFIFLSWIDLCNFRGGLSPLKYQTNTTMEKSNIILSPGTPLLFLWPIPVNHCDHWHSTLSATEPHVGKVCVVYFVDSVHDSLYVTLNPTITDTHLTSTFDRPR